MKASHEHEFEAAPGLPEPLPAGEKILWQGTPEWRSLAVHVFFIVKLSIYFMAMLVVQMIYLIGQSTAWDQVFVAVVKSGALGLTALGLLAIVAWFSSKTTLYTITDKRVVMRIGIVLTLTFNLPFKRITGAALKLMRGHVGDIALSLTQADRIGWIHLWPHARAWHLEHPEPTLRCLPDAEAVGQLLLSAWRAAHPAEQTMISTPVLSAVGVKRREGLVV